MRPVTESVSIDAPRERVFGFLSDLANRAAFTAQFMREYRLERLESAGVGAAARFRVKRPGASMWMETVIEEVEPPHLIFERGRCGRNDRIPVRTVWELLEGPGEMTDVKLSFWTEPAHPLDRLKERLGAHRWYRRHWSRALRALRDALESDEPVERVTVGGADRVAG